MYFYEVFNLYSLHANSFTSDLYQHINKFIQQFLRLFGFVIYILLVTYFPLAYF